MATPIPRGRRGNPIAKVGNYAMDVDSAGMDPEMQSQMFGQKMDKTESAYVAQAKNKATATEAVRRARRANKQAPLPPED